MMSGLFPSVAAILSASVMMAITGLACWLVMRRFSISSFRLRSLLAVAVLAQGLMFVRCPIHLGLIEAPKSSELLSIADRSEIPQMVRDGAPSQTTVATTVSHRGLESVAATRESVLPSMTSNLLVFVRQNWQAALLTTWGTVVLFMVALLCWRFLRLTRLVKQLDEAPGDWAAQWHSVVQGSPHAKHASTEMLISETVGPLLVRHRNGYSLIVPNSFWRSLSTDQRESVLIHELAHLERRDVWKQLIARSIVILHWFNPAAWWALREYEAAAECACDSRVARVGKHAKAHFASALLSFVQWHDENETHSTRHFGVGYQTMAAPPLKSRVRQLLQSDNEGDSKMKRLVLTLFAVALVGCCFFQVSLTTAEDSPKSPPEIAVVDTYTQGRLDELFADLDQSDPTTKRFSDLFTTPNGKIAISGMLNTISDQARNEVKSNAIPRFVEQHFTMTDKGSLSLKDSAKENAQRWIAKAKQLDKDLSSVSNVMKHIASQLDTSEDSGAIFARLLNDEQAPVAVLIGEMKGGDVVTRFISEVLNQVLVDRGNGTFTIVDSRRKDAQVLTEQFERADQIAKRLKRDLPALAKEYVAFDENHKRFISYLNNPMTAIVVSIKLSEDSENPSQAIEAVHEHFEEMSVDTAKGLVIQEPKVWEHLNEIFEMVDRTKSILPRVRQRLADVASTLATDDELTSRFAKQLQLDAAAVKIASELPYAEADAGQEFRALISEVLEESNGKLRVADEKADDLTSKARELLKTCRRVRRYRSEIQDLLDKFESSDLVHDLGNSAPYAILDEVRNFAERHQPDPIALLKKFVLTESSDGKLRMKEEHRDLVRKLIQQAEKLTAEAANDDF